MTTKLSILGHGAYTFAEAASLVRLTPQRVRSWFCEVVPGSAPPFRSDFTPRSGNPTAISFLDLIEVLVAGTLRERGLPLQYLRKAHEVLKDEFGTVHPFGHRELMTDGQRLFLREVEAGAANLREPVSGQFLFDDLVAPHLERLDWDLRTGLASRWRVAAGVLVDPARRCGAPILADRGLPTSIIAAAYNANGRDLSAVAAWYGIAVEDVRRAVDFEAQLSGKAA